MNEISDLMSKLGVRTEIFGNKCIIIEGCESIVEYKDEVIKVKSGRMYSEIIGKNLKITRLTLNSLSISGSIHSVNFSY